MSSVGIDERLAACAARLGDRVRRDVALGPLTTYRVGGPAALFFEVRTHEDIALVGDAVRSSGISVLVLGKGSNLLVSDAGFKGLALSLGEPMAGITIEATIVRAGGATALPVLARRTAAAALRGFEWAVGVPGSIGGAARMNAGGHGSDMAAVLRRVRVADLRSGEDGWVSAESLALGYRRSNLTAEQVVLEAELGLEAGDRASSEALISEIVRWRRENQPGGQNAGSVFTNPEDSSAGLLIERAGAKGMRLRSAAVSAKHANFIIADPGGSAEDVHSLMLEVQARVEAEYGVHLEVETRLVGFEPNPPAEIEA